MKKLNYKIIWRKNATNELNNIHQYISDEAFAPMAAAKLVKNIRNNVDYYLTYSPYWPLVDDNDLAKLGLRKMVVKNYIVFFIINETENTVFVERIIHGNRNWSQILRVMYKMDKI